MQTVTFHVNKCDTACTNWHMKPKCNQKLLRRKTMSEMSTEVYEQKVILCWFLCQKVCCFIFDYICILRCFFHISIQLQDKLYNSTETSAESPACVSTDPVKLPPCKMLLLCVAVAFWERPRLAGFGSEGAAPGRTDRWDLWCNARHH